MVRHTDAHRVVHIVARNDVAVRAKEQLQLETAVLAGEVPESVAIHMNGFNLRALRLLGPGGILVTCSCSHHLGEAMFLELIAQASRDAGRTVRVLERRTQSQDHPILLTVPETHYLKCLILEVM